MEKAGILTHSNRSMTQASGGQLQRAAICRALINDPDILFVDDRQGHLILNQALKITDLLADIEAGHTVEIISNEADKEINGKNGHKIQAAKGINDVKPSDYDALLISGGFSPDLLLINPKNGAFAKSFLQEDKPVFAICHRPQFLVETDLLKNAGAIVKGADVIVDNNLVTSRIPDDLPAFNGEALKLLEK